MNKKITHLRKFAEELANKLPDSFFFVLFLLVIWFSYYRERGTPIVRQEKLGFGKSSYWTSYCWPGYIITEKCPPLC